MSDSDDFTKLDDPEFLAERRRVRDALDSTQDSAASPDLTARLEAMNEFSVTIQASGAPANVP